MKGLVMSMDGIRNLIAVTQMKSANANDEAMQPSPPPPPPAPPKPIQVIADGAIVGGLASKNLFAAATLKTASYGDGDVVAHASAKVPAFVTALKGAPDSAMGNFEIQNLMSAYNQAETLANSTQKKSDDSKNGWLGKI